MQHVFPLIHLLSIALSHQYYASGYVLLYISCIAISTTHLNACTITLLLSMHASHIFCNTNTEMHRNTWILLSKLRCDTKLTMIPTCISVMHSKVDRYLFRFQHRWFCKKESFLSIVVCPYGWSSFNCVTVTGAICFCYQYFHLCDRHQDAVTLMMAWC